MIFFLRYSEVKINLMKHRGIEGSLWLVRSSSVGASEWFKFWNICDRAILKKKVLPQPRP